MSNNMNQREAKADEVLAAYKFGSDDFDDSNVRVVGHDNWDRSNRYDLTKIVYVQYRDEPADADSHKVSFHVRFSKAGEVEDAYALEMEHGNDIGCRGDVGSEKPKVKVMHTPRLLSIIDNLVAGSVAAVFAGIALPQWCGSSSGIDWGVEVMLALASISLYASGIFIQKGMEK